VTAFSVTEVRNALRCPRVFALGRMQGRAVAFPLGASSLGALFHRIAETFAQSAETPPESLRRLPAGASLELVEDVLAGWLVRLLALELERNPAHATMPAEIDDLAEALRQLAAYVARRIASSPLPPSAALPRFLRHAELDVEAPVAAVAPGNPAHAPGTHVRLAGRIDAIHAPSDASFEVVEYKLTDEANDALDRTQVALYRYLLTRHQGLDAVPVVLRFNPALRVTRMSIAEADDLAERTLLPLVGDMIRWADQPASAPATDRTDLCPACPLRVPCARTYRDHLATRDEPPSGSTRPRPDSDGEVCVSSGAPHDEIAAADLAGEAEAAALRDTVLAILERQGVSATVSAPLIVGPRLVGIQIAAARGRVAALDRAAADVVHRLRNEHAQHSEYVRDAGLRIFYAARRTPRSVSLNALLAARASWLQARPGRFVLGEGLDGAPITGDLGDPASCHLLVAGMTGSGKSVLLRSIIASLAEFHPPSAIQFVLVDPKRVSFAPLRASMAAHLATPICFDVEEALAGLDELVSDVEDRYERLARAEVQDLDEHNESVDPGERLPRKVVVVDEFQDLVASNATREPFLSAVQRLGAKARAAGIHLVLATQRPDAKTVPGLVKANLCGKIALKVQSATNSRIVLDRPGAENLLGKGDLLADLGDGVVRAQGAGP